MRSTGQWIEVSKPLLPGYVFVYSNEKQVRHDELAAVHHVARVLSLRVGTGRADRRGSGVCRLGLAKRGQYRRNESIADRRLVRDHGRRV